MLAMAPFQVKLSGEWMDYSSQGDKILKRAFMAGFPTARFSHRGQNYRYDFKRMVQTNVDTGKERQIRPPRNMKPPSKPVCPAGPTAVINVPSGSPGTTIQVPHPCVKGEFIAVHVPLSAKVGQAMLVPVPGVSSVPEVGACGSPSPIASRPEKRSEKRFSLKKESGSWSTGDKVAAGAVGAAALVGGVVLGDHIYEYGLDATVDVVGDGLEDAGAVVGEAAVDVGDFAVDAAEEAGDFFMDLF